MGSLSIHKNFFDTFIKFKFLSSFQVNDGEFRVRNVDGDSNLGGRDLDQILFDYCAETIKIRYDKHLKRDKRRSERIKLKCEEIKRALSTTLEERYIKFHKV